MISLSSQRWELNCPRLDALPDAGMVWCRDKLSSTWALTLRACVSLHFARLHRSPSRIFPRDKRARSGTIHALMWLFMAQYGHVLGDSRAFKGAVACREAGRYTYPKHRCILWRTLSWGTGIAYEVGVYLIASVGIEPTSAPTPARWRETYMLSMARFAARSRLRFLLLRLNTRLGFQR